MTTKRKAIIYVDGLNLYYGLLRGTEYRRLDIHSFVQSCIPHIEIIELKYFCARVPQLSHDPEAGIRQDVYLSALSSHSSSICKYYCIEGHFNTEVYKTGIDVKSGILTKIKTSEEKGTDVNIGVHMVNDSNTRDDFDTVFLLSNDSDLYEALRLSKESGKKTYVLAPFKRLSGSKKQEMIKDGKRVPCFSGKLKQYADERWERGVGSKKLQDNQLQNPCNGFTKPIGW